MMYKAGLDKLKQISPAEWTRDARDISEGRKILMALSQTESRKTEGTREVRSETMRHAMLWIVESEVPYESRKKKFGQPNQG